MARAPAFPAHPGQQRIARRLHAIEQRHAAPGQRQHAGQHRHAAQEGRAQDRRERRHAGAEHRHRVEPRGIERHQRLMRAVSGHRVDRMEHAILLHRARDARDLEAERGEIADRGLRQILRIGADQADAPRAQRAEGIAHRMAGRQERHATRRRDARDRFLLRFDAGEVARTRAGEGDRADGCVGKLRRPIVERAEIVQKPRDDGRLAGGHARIEHRNARRQQRREFRLHRRVGLRGEDTQQAPRCVLHAAHSMRRLFARITRL